MKKKLIAIAVVLVVGAALLITRLNSMPEEGYLYLSGNVEITEVDVGFSSPGKIKKMFADEGMKVKEGDKLSSIDSEELESEVDRLRAALSEARARFKELKAGARPQEIEQAKADAESAGADLIKTMSDLKRASLLYDNGAISEARFEAEERAYKIAKSRYKNVTERLSLIKEGPRIEVKEAQHNRVLQAEAALKAAEERLEDTSIESPIYGVVLRRHAESGEIVAAGIPVFTVGNLANPWIKVYIKEDQLGFVKLGQKAEVKTDSYPEKVYDGTITYISSEAEFTPKNVQTKEERVKLVFGAEISVQNVNDEIKPGMPADVRIDIR